MPMDTRKSVEEARAEYELFQPRMHPHYPSVLMNATGAPMAETFRWFFGLRYCQAMLDEGKA